VEDVVINYGTTISIIADNVWKRSVGRKDVAKTMDGGRRLIKDLIFLVYLASEEDKKERCIRCASPTYYYIEGTNKSVVLCKACGDSMLSNQRRYIYE
jgi:hypothetical protein